MFKRMKQRSKMLHVLHEEFEFFPRLAAGPKSQSDMFVKSIDLSNVVDGNEYDAASIFMMQFLLKSYFVSKTEPIPPEFIPTIISIEKKLVAIAHRCNSEHWSHFERTVGDLGLVPYSLRDASSP